MCQKEKQNIWCDNLSDQKARKKRSFQGIELSLITVTLEEVFRFEGQHQTDDITVILWWSVHYEREQ